VTTSITVLYSLKNDPLVSSLRNTLNAKLIHIDELADWLKAMQWPIIAEVDFPSYISNLFENNIVVNRIFTLEDTKINDHIKELEIDERWIHIRLMKLLASARRLTHDTGVRGVSRSLLPLNTQWFQIRQANTDIRLPKFVYGMGLEIPSDFNELSAPIQKSIWSIFDWREERHISDLERNRNLFFVERPIGIPIIIHYYGEKHFCYFPKEFTTLDTNVVDRIVTICSRVFKSEFGEILLYKEEDNLLRFYSFSPYLYSAAIDVRFEKCIGTWVDDIKCAAVT